MHLQVNVVPIVMEDFVEWTKSVINKLICVKVYKRASNVLPVLVAIDVLQDIIALIIYYPQGFVLRSVQTISIVNKMNSVSINP